MEQTSGTPSPRRLVEQLVLALSDLLLSVTVLYTRTTHCLQNTFDNEEQLPLSATLVVCSLIGLQHCELVTLTAGAVPGICF